jgi:hypothetical protein
MLGEEYFGVAVGDDLVGDALANDLDLIRQSVCRDLFLFGLLI